MKASALTLVLAFVGIVMSGCDSKCPCETRVPGNVTSEIRIESGAQDGGKVIKGAATAVGDVGYHRQRS